MRIVDESQCRLALRLQRRFEFAVVSQNAPAIAHEMRELNRIERGLVGEDDVDMRVSRAASVQQVNALLGLLIEPLE